MVRPVTSHAGELQRGQWEDKSSLSGSRKAPVDEMGSDSDLSNLIKWSGAAEGRA